MVFRNLAGYKSKIWQVLLALNGPLAWAVIKRLGLGCTNYGVRWFDQDATFFTATLKLMKPTLVARKNQENEAEVPKAKKS